MEAGGGSTGGPSRVGALEPPPAPRPPQARQRIYSRAGRSFLLRRLGAAPPSQGHPGVPAARGQAPVDPSAVPPPCPSQEGSPAAGPRTTWPACGDLRRASSTRRVFPRPREAARRGSGRRGGLGRGGRGLHPERTAGRAAPSPAAPAVGKRFALATCPFSGEGGLPTVTVQSSSLVLGARDTFFFLNKNHF